MKKLALFLALTLLAAPAWAKKFNPTNYPQTATICTFSGYNSTDKQAYSIANAVCIDSTGGVVFNEGAAAVDFRIEGDTEANLFFVDASAGRIGIRTSSPDADLEIGESAGSHELHISSTDAAGLARIRLIDGTTSWFIQNGTDSNFQITEGGGSSGVIELVSGAPNSSFIIDSSGNITVSGTVDGVDIAARDHAATTDTNANTICSGTSTYLDGEGNCDVLSISTTANEAITLGSGVTTFAITSRLVTLTGHSGANTIATITGASDGDILIIIFVDNLVTLTDDDTHAANTLDLPATTTPSDDDVLTFIFDGTSWYSTSQRGN